MVDWKEGSRERLVSPFSLLLLLHVDEGSEGVGYMHDNDQSHVKKKRGGVEGVVFRC